MDTSATCLIDAFDLCAKAIINESALFSCPSFDESHCKEDSRETDFNKVESRLAYLYKFGYFNIQFSEKCISKFLNEYSDSDTIFPPPNLKLCSLSSGPGLDIVGLFCALFKCNKSLKLFPQLKAVNFCDSWLKIYKQIIRSTYEVACQHGKIYECTQIDECMFDENIQFIESDIFADISPEAENFISNSNVLLMFRIFNSTKAVPDVQSNTLKKIFSLLKPGTLIFFAGSKNNMKNFSNCSSLSNSVKCIYGPQKVKLEKLLYPELLVDGRNIKPQDSGHAEFVVWQKRENGVVEKQKKSRKRPKRRKKKASNTATNLCCENMINENLDGSDIESEMTDSSSSKQSESLSDELINGSPIDVLNADACSSTSDKNGAKRTQYLLQKVDPAISSANFTISILDKGLVDNVTFDNSECLQPNEVESTNDIQHNDTENTDGKLLANKIKLFATKLKDPVVSTPKPNKAEKTENENLQNACSLLANVHISDEKLEFKDISLRNANTGKKSQTEVLTKPAKSQSLEEINFIKASSMKQMKILNRAQSEVSQKKVSKLPKSDQIDFNHSSTSLENVKSQTEVPSPLKRNKVPKKLAENSSIKNISKTNKMQSAEVNTSLSAENKNVFQAQDRVSAVNMPRKNTLNITRNLAAHETCVLNPSDRSNYDIQALIQRCDNLITALEKVTADLKCEVNSACSNNCMKKSCFRSEASTHFCALHSCFCTANIARSCYCRNAINCGGIKNICSANFSNSFPCRNNITESCKCKFERGTSSSSGPFITIPLQNADILNILSATRK